MAAMAAGEMQVAGATVPGVVRQRHANKEKLEGGHGMHGALSESLQNIRNISSGPLPAQARSESGFPAFMFC